MVLSMRADSRRLPAGAKGGSEAESRAHRQQCRTPGAGSWRPDSYAGPTAPTITGVSGQPPPIFTPAGRPRRTSTTPMLRQAFGATFLRHFGGSSREGGFGACAAADKTGRGRSRGRASSYQVTLSRPRGPGTAGGSLAGQHGCGSRIEGQAAPGSWALAGRWSQVGVDLAGDVSLEAA